VFSLCFASFTARKDGKFKVKLLGRSRVGALALMGMEDWCKGPAYDVVRSVIGTCPEISVGLAQPASHFPSWERSGARTF
jgi:hypothetical protein